ncbi:hypothetical protein AAFF_G00433040 [Aldrovandia affinis]|uniref:Secreted protein n=1 Tax=Aldrovandia affinis TaxID=143900 RepID=A0AAD7S936_9TELE|nr:hypothetical protein AAFF_G00433040 [Aldrovandia affinis]
MNAPIPLLILLYAVVTKSLKVVSKRGSVFLSAVDSRWTSVGVNSKHIQEQARSHGTVAEVKPHPYAKIFNFEGLLISRAGCESQIGSWWGRGAFPLSPVSRDCSSGGNGLERCPFMTSD